MKEISYTDGDNISGKEYESARAMIRKVIPSLEKKYGLARGEWRPISETERVYVAEINSFLVNTIGGIARVLNLFPGRSIKDLKVLDLGCGGTRELVGPASSCHRRWEPWFCRTLHELGCSVTGVDLGYLGDESFRHYKKDLLEPGALDDLPDSSIDVATADNFFDGMYLNDEEIQSRAKQILRPQLERVVKSDGVFLYRGEDWGPERIR